MSLGGFRFKGRKDTKLNYTSNMIRCFASVLGGSTIAGLTFACVALMTCQVSQNRCHIFLPLRKKRATASTFKKILQCHMRQGINAQLTKNLVERDSTKQKPNNSTEHAYFLKINFTRTATLRLNIWGGLSFCNV